MASSAFFLACAGSFRSVEMKNLSYMFAPVGLLAFEAMAAVPADVTTALTDAKTDSTTVAGLALVIVIAIAAIKYMRRAI